MPDLLRRAGGEAGFLTIQYVLAIALSLLLLTQVTNLLVAAYGRGAVRAALDEGVRAASVAGSAAEQCTARAEAVLTDLLGGAMGAGVGSIDCTVDADRVRARADTTFAAWIPGMPEHSFRTEAVAVREALP